MNKPRTSRITVVLRGVALALTAAAVAVLSLSAPRDVAEFLADGKGMVF